MASKNQPGQNDVSPSSEHVFEITKTPGNTAGGKNQILVRQITNPMCTVERLHGVRYCVVRNLFGKQHWAADWVIDLCEADSEFLLHLADQTPGYVHFICLVRLALLAQLAEEKSAMEYAHWIRTQSRTKILQTLYPSGPGGILGVLPKLKNRPLSQEDYQRLIRLLSDKTTSKYVCHVKRLRKFDIRLFGNLEKIPEEFHTTEVFRCIKTDNDFDKLRFLIKLVKRLEVKIDSREIDRATKKMKDLDQLASWVARKISGQPFPPPPWCGNDRIKPICSASELKKVARKFRNCSADYLGKIVCGYYYLYVDEQTSTMINMQNTLLYGWEVRQMKGIGNKDPTFHCKREIALEFSNAGFEMGSEIQLLRRAFNGSRCRLLHNILEEVLVDFEL